MINLLDQEHRIRLIDDINSENNKARKQWSLRSSEVSGGRMEQYVKERLLGELDPNSVKEMPIVSSINIQKAITDKKATIYKKKPVRRFTELSPESSSKVDLIYKDMKLNMKLNKSNKNFVYQDQSIGMIVPKNGKLIARIMKMHQIDVVPSVHDPETAEMYVLSAFDRSLYIQYDTDKKDYDTATGNHGRSVRSTASENQDLKIAEKYQFQKYIEKYVIWSNQYHFMMNGLGEVINPETGEMFEQGDDVDISNPIGRYKITKSNSYL